jgi:hypothetical protein
MVKQFIRNIKYLFLRTEHIRLLEEENTALQRALVESIDLVSDYKRAVQEMQRMISMIYKDNIDQMEEDLAEYAYRDSHRKDEGEDIEQKYYKAILKKTTIH